MGDSEEISQLSVTHNYLSIFILLQHFIGKLSTWPATVDRLATAEELAPATVARAALARTVV